MKKIITTISILALGAGTLLLAGCNKANTTTTASLADEVYAANYVGYSTEKRDQLIADGKTVAVFYHSSSCGTCKNLDKTIISEANQIPANMVVMKAPREDKQVKTEGQGYGVTKYHTLAVFQPGNTDPMILKGVLSVDDILDGIQEA